MQTQMRVLLGLLWLQTCCELRTSQREREEISQLNGEMQGRKGEVEEEREHKSLRLCPLL